MQTMIMTEDIENSEARFFFRVRLTKSQRWSMEKAKRWIKSLYEIIKAH